MIANFFYGVGSMIVFATTTTMLTEFMPTRASNGIALNNLARNMFACVGTIVADPLLSAIGNGWLSTIFALVTALGGALTIWAMRRFGAQWRTRMEEEMD